MSMVQVIVNLAAGVLALMVVLVCESVPLLHLLLLPWLVFIALDWLIATLIIRAVRRSRDAQGPV